MSVRPVRIQRKRIAGYNMHAVSRATNGFDCISVTRPGRWGNPFDVRVFGRELSMALFRNSVQGVWNPSVMAAHSDELCDAAYEAHLSFLKRFRGDTPLTAARAELRGHNLGCSLHPARRLRIARSCLNWQMENSLMTPTNAAGRPQSPGSSVSFSAEIPISPTAGLRRAGRRSTTAFGMRGKPCGYENQRCC